VSEGSTPAIAPKRTGTIAIAGRPNVGKSTLLNRLVGAKVSITSRKAQTTRHRILGVRTDENAQYVFMDTPGFQTRHRNLLNRAMNRAVTDALASADVALLVVDAAGLKPEDEAVIALLPKGHPAVLAINKSDQAKNQNNLLVVADRARQIADFAAIVPVSAKTGKNEEGLLSALAEHLPVGVPMYEEDMLTDRPERFLAAEMIREKVFRLSGEEIPYGCEVMIDKFEMDGKLRRIYATILVDRPGHKSILVGAGGEKMKRIGTEARQDMENLFGGKVFLELWVKVKGGWADSAAMLRSLGYQ
jgi:GTP-binding protein Era